MGVRAEEQASARVRGSPEPPRYLEGSKTSDRPENVRDIRKQLETEAPVCSTVVSLAIARQNRRQAAIHELLLALV